MQEDEGLAYDIGERYLEALEGFVQVVLPASVLPE
jgi:hypothetical protein